MATEAQVQANRSNAQKSTGPRTPEGKATVAQNAVKHGLLARTAVLHGEDWEEYTCFSEELLDELYPDSMVEQELADRIVSLSWRLRRATLNQNAIFETLYDKYAAEHQGEALPEPDPAEGVPADGAPLLGRMLVADFAGDRVLERMLMYERRIESSLYRTMAELRKRQGLRRMCHTPTCDYRHLTTEARSQRPVSVGCVPRTGAVDEAVRDTHPTRLCETKPICQGSRQTNPIPADADEGQVPCGTEVRNDSAENRPGKQSQFSGADSDRRAAGTAGYPAAVQPNSVKQSQFERSLSESRSFWEQRMRNGATQRVR